MFELRCCVLVCWELLLPFVDCRFVHCILLKKGFSVHIASLYHLCTFDIVQCHELIYKGTALCKSYYYCETRLPQGRWSGLYPLLVWEEQEQAPPLWCRLHDQNFHCQKIAELASWSIRLHHVPKTPNPGQQVWHCPQCVSTYTAGWNWSKGGLLPRPA